MSDGPHPDDGEAARARMAQADSRYVSFAPISAWLETTVDDARWQRRIAGLGAHRQAEPERFREAVRRLAKVASYETGAIEGLYAYERGFTINAMMGAAVWEAALSARDSRARRLIGAQIEAYEFILDLATGAQPVGQAHIRELHRIICSGQETYRAYTPAGWQELPLPGGAYKTQPNHVLQPDGSLHAYAPVSDVEPEMSRLIDQLATEDFARAQPIVQAAFAHHALVAVHPFADGNGRVARALASVFTYRSASIPILFTDATKLRYFESLARADRDHLQAFVDYVFDRAVEGTRLLDEILRSATLPSVDQAGDAIDRLFTTRGGYDHARVDQAGYAFFDLVEQAMKEQLERATSRSPRITWDCKRVPLTSPPEPPAGRRQPLVEGRREALITLAAVGPASASIEVIMCLEVPHDCQREDDLVIRVLPGDDAISAGITELVPDTSPGLELRLMIAAESIVAAALERLAREAEQALQRAGYRRPGM